jgi:hypothetical protein
MTKPWVIALWIAVFAFAGWLWSEGQRWDAVGLIASATFWEVFHRIGGGAKAD